jgi:hypothetical protein
MLGALLVVLMQAAAGDPAATSAPNSDPGAASPPQNITVTAPQNPDPLDQVHCHVEHVTGSLMPTRHCSTPRADAERTQHDRRAFQNMQNNTPTALPPQVGGG